MSEIPHFGNLEAAPEDLGIAAIENRDLSDLEDRIVAARPELQRAIDALNQLLAADTLDRARLERWVDIWNAREANRGISGESMELSGRYTRSQRHGRLRLFYFPASSALRIGYQTKEP